MIAPAKNQVKAPRGLKRERGREREKTKRALKDAGGVGAGRGTPLKAIDSHCQRDGGGHDSPSAISC